MATSDVIQNIHAGSGQQAGRVVLGVLPTGATNRLTVGRDVNSPPPSDIEAKYTD